MKTIPTFKKNGDLLTGHEAREAWAGQSARCNCGSYGDESEAIHGSAGDMPAVWLGCTNCDGTALGRPLVMRTQSQINFERTRKTA